MGTAIYYGMKHIQGITHKCNIFNGDIVNFEVFWSLPLYLGSMHIFACCMFRKGVTFSPTVLSIWTDPWLNRIRRINTCCFIEY